MGLVDFVSSLIDDSSDLASARNEDYYDDYDYYIDTDGNTRYYDDDVPAFPDR
mgnify:CR=1 FL=1|jgi:hypothetical protein